MSTDASLITADDARAAAANGTLLDLATATLPRALSYARTPISDFPVGAVAVGASGALHLGANLEFSGAPLGNSVHAEQAAVANAWAHGERSVADLVVTAVPCGMCRQFLAELTNADVLRVRVRDAPPVALTVLLPQAFGPGDLGLTAGLLSTVALGLAVAEGAANDVLVAAALAAARASYAPYSHTFAGVALETEDGAIHSGRSAENAAYNPSLPPLQAALVRRQFSPSAGAPILRAVLIETLGLVSHRSSSAALLAAISPSARLAYFPAIAS